MQPTCRQRFEALYRSAVYRVHRPGGPLVLALELPCPALAALLRAHGASCAALVTACNPRGRVLGAGANRRRQRALARELRALGADSLPADGGSADGKHIEPSLLAMGLDEPAARRLMRRFAQNAWLQVDAAGAPRLAWTDERPDRRGPP